MKLQKLSRQSDVLSLLSLSKRCYTGVTLIKMLADVFAVTPVKSEKTYSKKTKKEKKT